VWLENLDAIGIDDPHLVLAREEGGDSNVADRCLELHEMGTELVLANPPGQCETLMGGAPQFCGETVAFDVQCPGIPCCRAKFA
jgi:hypothetical protein